MIDKERLERELSASTIGRRLHCLDEIDSTNRFILSLAKGGAPEGTVACADYQTNGRGRLSRKWLSAQGENLLVSILLRPKIEIRQAQKITLAAAVILYKALTRYVQLLDCTAIEFDVKWPNDLLADGEKISGILAESVFKDKTIEVLALGFGINLNMKPAKSDGELLTPAASLKELTGQEIDRTNFLTHFLNRFEKEYYRMESAGFEHVVSEWKSITRQIGRPIIVSDNTGKRRAEFIDLNPQGHLVYKMKNGAVSELIAGDVQWL